MRIVLMVALALSFGCDGSGSGEEDSGTDAPGFDGGPDFDADRPDAGPDNDAGDLPDGSPGVDVGPIEPTAGCAEISESIIASTGTTITVRPTGDGTVMVDGGGEMSLRNAIRSANDGDTVLLEDGTYTLPAADPGGFSGVYITTPNVTVRGASGNADAVIIDSAYRLHGSGSSAIVVDAPGVVLADFTVRRAVYHLIHLWADGDDVLIHNVRMLDGGQQFLKSSPGSSASVDNVEVSCSTFLMTNEGRDNVWGYGALDGNTSCYTGGIDTHDSRNWHVHDSRFEGIYCLPDGPRRPAHGQAPDERGGETYVGGLSEHAIHMWDSAEGSGHLIERNHIINCARGIGLGFRTDVYGSIIRNNLLFSSFAASREHDVGIGVERAHNTEIHHNTIFFSNGSAYPNSIEYRYDVTSNVTIHHNLVNGRIHSRNDAVADVSGNNTDAEASWFRDGANGDLHLASCDVEAMVGTADEVTVETDVDGESRTRGVIGADECEM